MSKWVPPVPAGKLYGRDALALGSGLAMLLWCYDGVERDGSVKVDLMAVASELETPYRTIKGWWKALRDGPFFASVKDRGKLGYVATFNRDWIEWRVMATNYPTMETSEGQFPALEETLNVPEQVSNPVQGPVKAPSRTDEGQIAAPDGRMYKVLHTDKDHIEIAVASDDAPAAQPTKKKRPAKTEPQSPIEVRRAIAKGSQIDLDSGLQKDIIQVNQVAATIWNKLRTPDQALDSVLSDIRACGKWVRNSQHPYKGSDQCMPPSALVRFWPAWKESAKPKTPYLNGHANGTHAPAEPAISLDEQRRRTAEAASKYPARPGGVK